MKRTTGLSVILSTSRKHTLHMVAAGPSYSQDQDQDQGQDPGPDFGHHWRRIKLINVAKNIKISIEYQNWHNIVYIYQFLTRKLFIYHFFWLLEFDYFLALQHESNYLGQGCPGLLTHSGVAQPQLVTSNQQWNRKRHTLVSPNRN